MKDKYTSTFPLDKLRAVLTENLCYSLVTWDTSNLLDEETRGDYFLRFKLVIKNAAKEGYFKQSVRLKKFFL